MVRPRQPQGSLRDEFAGGLLPGLTSPLTTKGANPQGDKTTSPLGDSSPNHQSTTAPTPSSRRKVAFYLDMPTHLDLIDELLSALRRASNLPRDQSMLIRALLDQAKAVLADPARLQALADACIATLPNR